MPSAKQPLSRIKLQARYRQRTTIPNQLVPELRMSGNWLQAAGFAIGAQVEIEMHPEGLLIKKPS